MKRRIEPEPALGGKVGRHFHVGNQETVAKYPAFAFQSHQFADGAFAAVGRHHMGRLQRVGAIGRVDRQLRVIGMLLQRGDAAAPAQVEPWQFLRAFMQIAFHIVLLQIDKGRPLVAVLGQQVEAVNLFVAHEDAAEVPADALVRHALATAQAVEDFERAF